MTRHVLPILLVAAGIALAHAGCSSLGTPASDPHSTPSPKYVGLWSLVSIEGVETAPILGDATPPTLEIVSDGQVTGFTGVNRMSSRFDPGASRRSEPLFGPIMSTKMGGPEHLMAVESLLTSALRDTRASSIESRMLVLRAADGRELARFAPTAP